MGRVVTRADHLVFVIIVLICLLAVAGARLKVLENKIAAGVDKLVYCDESGGPQCPPPNQMVVVAHWANGTSALAYYDGSRWRTSGGPFYQASTLEPPIRWEPQE